MRPAPEGPLRGPQVENLAGLFPGLYLGTSSWSFPGWEGLVYDRQYPETRLAQSGLSAYSAIPLFRTVSLDRTYYRSMTVEEFQKLRAQVPDTFRFVVKAPRDLLKPTRAGFDLATLSREFLTPLARGLGVNLGVVLLQFPPGSLAEWGSGFVTALGRLLRSLPQDLSYSLELRDEELLGPHLRAELEGTSASLCASIHPHLPDPDQQLLKVPPTVGTPIVFRWNLRPSLDYKQAKNDFSPFRQLALEDHRRRHLLARLVWRALQAGRAVYLTANNKAEGCAPLTLLKFLEELSSLNP